MSSVPLEVSVTDVKKMLDEKQDFLLIDCREPHEYENCRIEGSKLIPMRETQTRLEEIESYRNRTVVVHCHHGGRSMRVTMFLRQLGFQNAQNMAGGIDAWSIEVDPSVPRY